MPGDVVAISHIGKAHDSVHCHSINKADDSGEHLNLQLLNEERALFSVEVQELGLDMSLCDLTEVHVHNLASLEVFVIEMANYELASCHVREEFGLSDFSVLTMAFNLVLLKLLIVVFEFSYATLSNVAHDLLLLII